MVIFKTEWKNIVRNRWVGILSIVLLALCFFAVQNGSKRTSEINLSIAEAKAELHQLDEKYQHQIDSIEKGLISDLSPWSDPSMLSVIAHRGARVLAKEPNPLAIVSTGQSDLYSHWVKPGIRDQGYALGFSELSNPVQLLFGSFDLAFVIIYILPLLALAFSYNLFSSEKELGTLRLTLSQPVSPLSWLFQKMLLRFLLLYVLSIFGLFLALSLLSPSVYQEPAGLLQLALIVFFYLFFWFLLALLINSFGKNSGQNAIALVSCWVALVLIIPSLIAHASERFFPVPSRVKLLNELRIVEAETNKKLDKVLDDFYRDHPELALAKEDNTENIYGYWLNFFASQDQIKKALDPVVNNYDNNLQARQNYSNRMRFFSPSLLVHNGLNEVSQSSERHYQAYRSQVGKFAEEWRAFFMPRMFNNEKMKNSYWEQLPTFQYRAGEVSRQYASDLSTLVLFSILLSSLTLVFFGRGIRKGLILN